LALNIYVVLGQIFITLLFILLVLAAAAAAVGAYIYKYKRFPLPKLAFSLITLFYRPLKTLLGSLHINPNVVDEVQITLLNHAYREKYAATPFERRILFLPQCLRDLDCPAMTKPGEGILCRRCGRCNIAEIMEICERYGIMVCIAPGGEFVKRVVKDKKPEAALGVACHKDLHEVMRYVTARGIPMVGVLLARAGCIMTDVDWDKVKEELLLTPEKLQEYG